MDLPVEVLRDVLGEGHSGGVAARVMATTVTRGQGACIERAFKRSGHCTQLPEIPPALISNANDTRSSPEGRMSLMSMTAASRCCSSNALSRTTVLAAVAKLVIE